MVSSVDQTRMLAIQVKKFLEGGSQVTLDASGMIGACFYRDALDLLLFMQLSILADKNTVDLF